MFVQVKSDSMDPIASRTNLPPIRKGSNILNNNYGNETYSHHILDIIILFMSYFVFQHPSNLHWLIYTAILISVLSVKISENCLTNNQTIIIYHTYGITAMCFLLPPLLMHSSSTPQRLQSLFLRTDAGGMLHLLKRKQFNFPISALLKGLLLGGSIVKASTSSAKCHWFMAESCQRL